MLDRPMIIPLQRTRGRAELSLLRCPEGRTRLRHLFQSGSAKAMLPRVHRDEPEIVFLNTAGGVTGGDHLSYSIRLQAGAQALASTQTAERAYRSSTGSARIETVLDLGPGAELDWLPQETILFEGSDLRRDLDVTLAADARFTFCDMLVLGREAMGEDIMRLNLHDARRIRRDGVLIYRDTFGLTPDRLDCRQSPALLGTARAVATLGVFAPGAQTRAAALRGMSHPRVRQAVSGWDDKLLCRFVSDDPAALKAALVDVIGMLRDGPLPRVWQL